MLQKIENYKRALTQLEEAVKCYRQAPDDTLYRDGLIQRFEFTVELAWKSMKEYLEDQGMVLSIRKMGNDALLEVAFDQVGTKKLMLRAAAPHMEKM